MFRIDEIRSLNINGVNYYPTFQLGSRHIFLAVGIILLLVLLKDLLLNKFLFWRTVDKMLLTFSVGVILSVSMLPLMILQHRDFFEQIGYGKQKFYASTNLLDLQTLLADPTSRFQIVGNLFLLVPWVVCIAILYRQFRRFSTMLILSFVTSIVIETLQLILNYFYFSNRMFDFADIVTNTLGGAVIGFIGFQLVKLITPFLITDKPVK